MSTTFSVAGRVAIVTGASSGLGRRFAEVLHAEGAHVVAAARRTDRLEQLAAECPGIVPVSADLADGADVERIVATAVERFGRVDILVNNAGFGIPAPAIDESIDDFRAIVEVNLVGLFDLARTAARVMIEQGGGSIVNVSSILGSVASMPIPAAGYCASKGAVTNLTRELACQWARKGVRVNALAPGYFPSETTAPLLDDPGALGHVTRNTPMGRMGEPHELDGALLFLASDASSFCTGHVLVVDGGWTAR
jgi:NAD(P)-dependent dehydrogenase (short-subunit alcohol dehydrogenase family)